MENTRKEKIVIVGYGWVGQANAIALTRMGYRVFFYDTAPTPTLHYLEDAVDSYGQIERAPSIGEVDGESTWFLVCVGDRVGENFEQDISLIKGATDQLKQVKGHVVLRSTVLPQKLSDLSFEMYLPEFLHEKNAIEECINPHFFVVGTREYTVLPSFMKEWERRAYRVFKGTPEEASYVKYLSNIWNSVRIAFVNEMGDSMHTPKTKEDVERVERVLDFVLERKSYLRYGQSFDGHCLPKDTRAFIGAHAKEGKNVDLVKGAYSSNTHHKTLQEQYKSLPEVYSFWERSAGQTSLVGVVWHRINEIPSVKKVRKKSRFIIDQVSKYVPDRTIEEVGVLWEERSVKNPLYYTNPGTRSGALVTDTEVRETGKKDYDRYIASDATLRALRSSDTFTGRVLDFGSGVGRVTEYLLADFADVHGIDISKTMIAEAQKRVPKATFTHFDGYVLPYGENNFDVIFSYQVLQYAPRTSDVGNYLKEFYRTLKPGGVAKVQLRGGRGLKKWEWMYGVPFTPEEAVLLAEEYGFEVLDHQVEGIKNIWLVLKK